MAGVTRRTLLASALGTASFLGTPRSLSAQIQPTEWLAYTTRYLVDDGRIVDTSNNGISHSEGQGYAMLLAVAFDDRSTFDQLWTWTRKNLQARNDRLFSWKWDPNHKGGQISDPNNATDGDILIAWALLRASQAWDVRAYSLAAELINRDVLASLIVETDFGPVMLPADRGFEKGRSIIINPSYYVFPAMHELAEASGDNLWLDLSATGLEILKQGRFGKHELPPDWLEVTSELQPAPGFEPVYGFNAVRIPLYVAWQDGSVFRQLLEPFVALSAAFGGLSAIPATINLEDSSTAEFPLSTGGQAILKYAAATLQDRQTEMPMLRPDEDYYSSTLLLLSKVAMQETLGI